MSVLIWIVMSVLGLGTLSSTGADEASATAVEPTPMAAAASPAPLTQSESDALEAGFARRDALPPCGVVDVSRARTASRLTPPAKAWKCLQDSVGFQGAELATIDERPNGLIRHTFYRALPDGDLEIWAQTMRLSGGDAGSHWTFDVCTPSEDIRAQPCAV